MFSAVSVGGKRLYNAAREGLELERPARPVRVAAFRVSRAAAASTANGAAGEPCRDVRYVVRCGKGTYIRSLVHELGRAAGTCAHVRELRREASGDFNVADAWQLPALLEEAAARGLGADSPQSGRRESRKGGEVRFVAESEVTEADVGRFTG
jgi:tRNA pseudouridine55 synthase